MYICNVKPHTKIYFKYFNIALDEVVSCEVCGKRAVDIHHIEARGMGGTSKKDDISNLMAVCRECHIEYGDKKEHLNYLKEIHNKYICQTQNNGLLLP